MIRKRIQVTFRAPPCTGVYEVVRCSEQVEEEQARLANKERAALDPLLEKMSYSPQELSAQIQTIFEVPVPGAVILPCQPSASASNAGLASGSSTSKH